MTIDARATIDALSNLALAIEHGAQNAIAVALDATVANAKATTLFNDRTGKTRQSIKSGPVRWNTNVTARGAAYFLENGTRGRPSTSSKGNHAFRFVVNGGHSWHRGITPRPFMLEARNLGEQVLWSELEKQVEAAVR